MKEQTQDKWLYLPVVILLVHFFYRLINQAKLLTTFPLDFANDISAYMALLFFLGKCGFHNFCPYWYNGIILFKFYPPGWAFFAYPLYTLTKDVLSAAYISIILMFLISFLFIYLLGKANKFSFVKILAFFTFFFANTISIGNFIRLGRVTEMFAWVNFLGLAFLIFYYKDKKLDWKFVFFSFFYALIILSHQTVAILSQFLVLSLLLIKPNRERLKIIIYTSLGLLLSAFWWVPFILDIKESSMLSYSMTKRLLDFSGVWLWTNLASFFVISIFLATFYFYWKSHKNSKEFLFFSPILFLSLIFVLRIVTFIPFLKDIFPASYITFFLFFALYFFFKTDFKTFSPFPKKIIPLVLIALSIASITVSTIRTPLFVANSELDRDTISILPLVNQSFLLGGVPFKDNSYYKAYYSYAPIYFDLATPYGWTSQVANETHIDLVRETQTAIENDNCDILIENMNKLHFSDIITYDDHCNVLAECGFKIITRKNRVCLIRKERI